MAKIDPKVYETCVGRYRLSHDTVLTLTRDGERLMAQVGADPSFEIFPECEAKFFVKPSADTSFTFVKDEKEKVSHLVLHHDGRDTNATRLEERANARRGEVVACQSRVNNVRQMLSESP